MESTWKRAVESARMQNSIGECVETSDYYIDFGYSFFRNLCG